MDAAPSTILDLITTNDPDRPAIRSLDGGVLTYRDLTNVVHTTRGALRRLDVDSDRRVAVVLDNGPLAATAFIAVASHTAAAPLNPALTAEEFAFYLGDLDAAALIVGPEPSTAAVQAAEQLGIPVVTARDSDSTSAGAFVLDTSTEDDIADGRPDASAPALVLHTSGTTGRPKIVELTHRNLATSSQNVAHTLRLTNRDVCLNVMPLFHIHGIVAALLATLSVGGSVVATAGYSAPRFLEWLSATGATWYTAVPTIHQSVIDRLHDGHTRPTLPNLRIIRSSSSSMAPSTLEDLEALFGVPVIEAYGMTEAAHQIASNQLPPGPARPGTVGIASGPEITVVDDEGGDLPPGEVGEVAIRGDNVITAYAGDRGGDSFFGEGWFRTGDLGTLAPDGVLTLAGRIKETINRGGETIAPRGIDEALLEISGVRQAMAFAVPDESLGEEVAAAVVLAEGADLSETDVRDALEGRLSFARMPKRIVIVDEIPKGPTGKLKRIGLADVLGIKSVRSPSDTSNLQASDAATPTMERIRRLWSDVLERDDVGFDEAFLESGGDSLAATALLVSVEDSFDVDVPVMAFYDAATVRQQAALIDELVAGG